MNFYTQFANPAKTVYTWNRSLPASRQAFIAGDTALYIGFASERPFLTLANPNLDFDMVPIPQPGVSSEVTTYGTLYAFAIPKASRNPAGAFSAALALSDAEPLLSVARVASMAPARRTLLVPSQQDLFSPVFYPQALVARSWLSPLPVDTDSVFASMISDITSGRRDTADALRTAEQALNATIP
jgi:ABC-type glycerol-3-phosphate transport system substrate-binding protein